MHAADSASSEVQITRRLDAVYVPSGIVLPGAGGVRSFRLAPQQMTIQSVNALNPDETVGT